ncbi:vacuolar protein sorting-associated protein 25 [Phtheirospermum japonicum]|uniref:ESCRT-II complex subunit VPS25 n=1 Tax=Phtheirospermum japonicum TaxID=374723 RepID=A0A830AY15_9LAMI|nr:vacuolar protein sorting-associated protein 25 [Phtheirospermum japonicum]
MEERGRQEVDVLQMCEKVGDVRGNNFWSGTLMGPGSTDPWDGPPYRTKQFLVRDFNESGNLPEYRYSGLSPLDVGPTRLDIAAFSPDSINLAETPSNFSADFSAFKFWFNPKGKERICRRWPVKDTREKQIQLWRELILDYCRTQKVFVVGLDEDFPLFSNPAIERSLSHEAREAFLSALVAEGRAEWLDKNHRKCLILWHRIQDWADLIIRFVKDNGLEDSVMTVEEIRSGIESRGTELHGVDRTILMRALKQLEHKGKLAIFKGTSADDEGVKFSI